MKPKELEAIEKALDFELGYGKFKDKTLDEVPSWYLKWLAGNIKNDSVAIMADLVYEYRESTSTHIWD